MGRRSYEFFGARWRARTGALADRVNSLPKYVVSSTLHDPDWNDSIVLKGDVLTEVSTLKQELDGEIVIPASYQLGAPGAWQWHLAPSPRLSPDERRARDERAIPAGCRRRTARLPGRR